MAVVCLGCQKSVDPLHKLVRSPENGKEWIVLRCPRDRCQYNIDIEEKPIREPYSADKYDMQ